MKHGRVLFRVQFTSSSRDYYVEYDVTNIFLITLQVARYLQSASV